MGATDVAADRALPRPGYQPGNMGAKRWNLFNVLSQRGKVLELALAMWAALEGDFFMRVYLLGDLAASAGMKR